MAEEDYDFDLLAPQRSLASLRASQAPKKKKKQQWVPSRTTAASNNTHKKGEDEAVKLSPAVESVKVPPVVPVTTTKTSLQDVIASPACQSLLGMLNTRSLLILAGANSSIRRSFLDIRCDANISFHDLACIIKKNSSFGVLSGCSLLVGTDGESVQSEDIVHVTGMLQNPKTQLNVTFVEFNAKINNDVVETQVVEFLRSFRFPPLLSLTSVNLEGSLIGAKGVNHFCSILRKNCLPNLKKLNLNRNLAYEKGVRCLYQVLCNSDCCPLLESLSLSSNRAEMSVLEFYCGQVLRSRPALTFLDISENNICLADGNAIVTMKNNKPQLNTLHTLDMSFNPVEDEGMYALFTSAWGLGSKLSSSPPSISLRHLYLVNCNIGKKTFEYLGDLIKDKYFPVLETLSLGMNNAFGKNGLSTILDALCPIECRLEKSDDTEFLSAPALKHLLVPFNNFNNEGLSAILSAALLGGFCYLETLDISNIGASADNVTTFINKFVEHARCDCLKKLVVFGRHPFAQHSTRSCDIPAVYLKRVKVS